MSNVNAIELMVEQRKRMVAGIMNHAEKSGWWAKLRPEEQRAFRGKVLDSTGVFTDLCRDLVKVTGAGSAVNDEALELIREVHRIATRV